MKKYIIILLLLCLSSFTYAQQYELASWSIHSGFSSDQLGATGQRFIYTLGGIAGEALVGSNLRVEIGFVHCSTDSTCDCMVGLDGLENGLLANGLKIFPNPTTEKLYIESELNQSMTYRFFTMDGKEVLQGNVDQKTVIDLNGLAGGFYQVLLYDRFGKPIYQAKISKK